jgi:magnesium chelatase subunit I
VLEERDVQIRGYPVRLNLDLCMVFSANPEDYTNRGRIVTPLKDRIGSVIRTHYPLTRELGIAISDRNAWLDRDGGRLAIPAYIKEVVEEMSRLARTSSHVNQQSGVSVRMSIANLENVVSNAERRALLNRERWIVPRVSDLVHAIPSSRGKLELTMNEDDGQEDKLIERIAGEAVKNVFGQDLDVRDFRPVVDYFEGGRGVEVGDTLPAREVLGRVDKVPGLRKRADELARAALPDLRDSDARAAAAASAVEFILEGLYVHNKLNKTAKAGGAAYKR